MNQDIVNISYSLTLEDKMDFTEYTIAKGSSYYSDMTHDDFIAVCEKIEPIEVIIKNTFKESQRYIGLQSYIYKDNSNIEIYLIKDDKNEAFILNNQNMFAELLQNYKVDIHTIYFSVFTSVWKEL